ncbi:MAG: hydroxyacid dehydrogenase [Nakamurella sp.]
MTANPPQGSPRIVLAMGERTRRELLPPALVDRLRAAGVVEPDVLVQDFSDPQHTARLATVDVLLTGWGAPRIDNTALARMPRLSAVVHGAGSVKELVDRRVFERGIVVSSAVTANAVPVAEFTFAAIIFAAKRVNHFVRVFREQRTGNALHMPVTGVGAYGLTIGVVGASRIGRRLITLLHSLDVHILLADPTIDAESAAGLGVELTELDDLLRRSDIVTVHAPNLPQTHHLLDARRLALMRDGVTLINTSRGTLVDTAALMPELLSGRLEAVLDVTDPQPPAVDSPLFDLPNVLLTPHIAGSLGNEVARLGELAVTEIERLSAGLPLEHAVHVSDMDRIA